MPQRQVKGELVGRKVPVMREYLEVLPDDPHENGEFYSFCCLYSYTLSMLDCIEVFTRNNSNATINTSWQRGNFCP